MGQIDKDKARSIKQNRSGYKTSTKTTIKDERGSSMTEHFDGRVDAEVRPAPVVVESTAELDKED